MTHADLTQLEHDTIGLLGKVYGNIVEITRDGNADGKVANEDLAEVAGRIHDLQHLVMAQAAARAYPDRYRLLGNVIIE